MPLIPGRGHVSENIREFHKGPTFQRTQDKFGKPRADKQAVAVALHEQDGGSAPAQRPASPQEQPPQEAAAAPDHASAVAAMNPEAVHRLVQDAQSGKYGPEAQQAAQQASGAPAQGEPDGDEGRDFTGIFSGAQEPDGDEAQPLDRAAMFAGSRRG